MISQPIDYLCRRKSILQADPMMKKPILTFQVVELCYNLPKGKSPHNPKLAPTPIVGGDGSLRSPVTHFVRL